MKSICSIFTFLLHALVAARITATTSFNCDNLLTYSNVSGNRDLFLLFFVELLRKIKLNLKRFSFMFFLCFFLFNVMKLNKKIFINYIPATTDGSVMNIGVFSFFMFSFFLIWFLLVALCFYLNGYKMLKSVDFWWRCLSKCFLATVLILVSFSSYLLRIGSLTTKTTVFLKLYSLQFLKIWKFSELVKFFDTLVLEFKIDTGHPVYDTVFSTISDGWLKTPEEIDTFFRYSWDKYIEMTNQVVVSSSYWDYCLGLLQDPMTYVIFGVTVCLFYQWLSLGVNLFASVGSTGLSEVVVNSSGRGILGCLRSVFGLEDAPFVPLVTYLVCDDNFHLSIRFYNIVDFFEFSSDFWCSDNVSERVYRCYKHVYWMVDSSYHLGFGSPLFLIDY